MFTARWRWNLGRALTILRMKGGRKNPPPIQRMEADDLMAAIFPSLAACQEHQAGPIEIPDHPIVTQTLEDCLHEAMDVDALETLFEAIERGAVRVHARDTTEPSPLCHEILNGRPYTFLDDAPLEERRTRAVSLRRRLPDDARDLARLDPEAIARVREEARPQPRDAQELHDLLLASVVLRPRADWQPWFAALSADGRAAAVETGRGARWLAAEKRPAVEALFPGARIAPHTSLPPGLAAAAASSQERAALAALRGLLDCCGPTSLARLADETALPEVHVEQAVARLEAEGFALRGRFEPGAEEAQVCARRLLARIHLYTQERLRREIEPVTAQDLMRFLLRWQHVVPETRREGRRGVLAVVEQLQGFELGAGAWEPAVLCARVAGYRPEWLDDLCLSGELTWGRLSLRAVAGDTDESGGRGVLAPSRATPITLAAREDLPWLLAAVRADAVPALPAPGTARDAHTCLCERGALFLPELVAAAGGLPVQVEQGLWELVARGLVTADGFQSVRALLGGRKPPASGRPGERRRRLRRRGRGARGSAGREGRWALLAAPDGCLDRDALAEAVAEQLLARWGVVFRELLVRESFAVPWRELLWALRRMEARGTIRGGRFVTGFVGEQYALPGAVDALRATRRLARHGEVVRLSAADPLNLVGILTPGPRLPAIRTRHVVYRDGLPADGAPGSSATPLPGLSSRG
jgi:ATP-dependent Lhr-like helicase